MFPDLFFHFPRSKAGVRQIRVVVKSQTGPVPLRMLKIEPATRRQVRLRADQLYAATPTLKWTPDPDRWEHLVRFRDMLRQGGERRVVMPGDSIINDTGNAPMDVLIEAQYAGLKLELITSVGNNKGCTCYRQENRVREYVTRHRPDLVMTGAFGSAGRLGRLCSPDGGADGGFLPFCVAPGYGKVECQY